MDMRDLSVARSYAKDILVAEIGRTGQPMSDSILEARWDRLSNATLNWYHTTIVKMKKEGK